LYHKLECCNKLGLCQIFSSKLHCSKCGYGSCSVHNLQI